MSKSIKISPKHGLNPAIPVCFFCGKPKDELILFGKLKNDIPAPSDCVIDYEPCEKCRAIFDENILLMGVTTTPTQDQPPIQDHLYPTGSYMVVKREAVPRIFPEKIAKTILEKGKAFLEEPAMQSLMKAANIPEE